MAPSISSDGYSPNNIANLKGRRVNGALSRRPVWKFIASHIHATIGADLTVVVFCTCRLFNLVTIGFKDDGFI